MVKIVELKINGNLQTGANINIEISTEISHIKNHRERELTGNLPANPALANQSQNHWEKQYRSVGAPYRIKKGKVTRENDQNHHQQLINCQNSAKELSENFNQWLKSPQFDDINDKLRTYLIHSEEIRILVRTEDPDLQKMPWDEWEILQDFPHAEIALSSLESVNQSHNYPINKNKTKVKILAILGHKEGINLDKDQQILNNLPQTQVTFLVEPEKKDINDQLWEQKWDIIFFAGHSETEKDTGRIYINSKPHIWENSLTTDELWIGLKKAVENGLQLAIFNSCDGLGLSQKINDWMIPQMIIMRELVPDQVAQEFLKYFLGEYSKGKSLYLAVKEAKERLKILENQFPCANWLPIIFQHPQIKPPKWEDLRTKSITEKIYPLLKYKYQFAGGILIFFGIMMSYFILPPKISDYFNQKAVESMRKGEDKEATKLLNLALKMNPENSEALTNLSNIESFWDPDSAIKHGEDARKLFNTAGCNNEGFGYLQKKDYVQAEKLFTLCLNRTKDQRGKYAILKNLALLSLEQGDYRNVETRARRAIALGIGTKEGIANCLLAKSLEKQNIQNQETLTQWQYCWQNARDKYPEEQELRQESIQKIEELQQKLPK
jgi:tetratricopeptide (TPR) repeat protein